MFIKRSKKYALSILSAIFFGAMAVAFMVTNISAQVLNPDDDFNDDQIDPIKWFVSISDPVNGFIEESNQELHMILSSGSSGATFYNNLRSMWLLGADFDIQVDYHLYSWPLYNGIRVGLTVSKAPNYVENIVEFVSKPIYSFPLFGHVERMSDSTFEGEVAMTHFIDGVQGTISTNDTSGTLRLSRTGSTITGFIFNNGNWIPLLLLQCLLLLCS